eukprot:10201442-Alexandrium_andersonii.AAC.1
MAYSRELPSEGPNEITRHKVLAVGTPRFDPGQHALDLADGGKDREIHLRRLASHVILDSTKQRGGVRWDGLMDATEMLAPNFPGMDGMLREETVGVPNHGDGPRLPRLELLDTLKQTSR